MNANDVSVSRDARKGWEGHSRMVTAHGLRMTWESYDEVVETLRSARRAALEEYVQLIMKTRTGARQGG